MKILYITTIGGTMIFFKSFVQSLLDKGHTVDIACNETDNEVLQYYRERNCRVYAISCERSPFSANNIKAVKEIKQLVKENRYDIVHCHTPVAGACTRFACRSLRKNGTKVFYTAHGFHFYKGAPLKNWMIYYPVEKLCSRFTDVIITINKEDYEFAGRKLKAPRVEGIPGVGINVDRFKNAVADRSEKRNEIGIPEDALLLFSVGELNKNKNHEVVIRALAQLNDENVHYMIAGEGYRHDFLIKMSQELGVADRVHILGYRTDVAELYKIADIDVFPSLREGFGLASIEGMAAGLPLVCEDNRGTREYALNGQNAIVCYASNADEYAAAIMKLSDEKLRKEYGLAAMKSVEKFDVSNINKLMNEIYFGS